MVEKVDLRLKELGSDDMSLDLTASLNIMIDILLNHNTSGEEELTKTLMYLINKINLHPKRATSKEYSICLNKLKTIKKLTEKMIYEIKICRDYVK